MITTEPGLNFRRSQLLTEIRKQGGRWTTGRAQAFYRREQLGTYRKTARDDLKFLVERGHMICIDEGTDRYFLLDTRVGATA